MPIDKLWDLRTNLRIGPPLKGHQIGLLDSKSVNAVAFNPSGSLLASAGSDGTVRLWDVRQHRALGEPLTVGSRFSAFTVAFSRDGHLLASAGTDGAVHIWNVAQQRILDEPLHAESGYIFSVAFGSEAGTLVYGDVHGMFHMWDLTASVGFSNVVTNPHKVNSDEALLAYNNVVFSPDGSVLAGAGVDGKLHLWDTSTGKPLDGDSQMKHETSHVTDHKLHPITSLAFNPDGSLLVSGDDDGKIHIWNWRTRSVIKELRGHNSIDFNDISSKAVTSLAFTQNPGVLASGGMDGAVRLWSIPSFRALGKPLRNASEVDPIVSLATNEEGNMLIAASFDSIMIWDVAKQTRIGEPIQIDLLGMVRAMALSPTGKVIVIATGSGALQFWDLSKRLPLGQPVSAHTGAINGLAFNEDGNTLATVGADGNVKMWNVATQTALGAPLTGHTKTEVGGRSMMDVVSVAFSPDGRSLATSGIDGTVRLWDVAVEAWMRDICLRVGRNLTKNEWIRFVGTAPYEVQCPRFTVNEN